VPKDICLALTNCFHELWILGKLLREFPDSFFYLPQVDIHYGYDKDDKNEVDLICGCDGRLIIGEAKTSSSGFEHTSKNSLNSLDKLLKIARVIKPDWLILAYEEDNDNIVGLEEKIKAEGFSVKRIQIFSQEKLHF
jgi:hypothetical protein